MLITPTLYQVYPYNLELSKLYNLFNIENNCSIFNRFLYNLFPIGDYMNKAFSYLSVVNDSILFALRILISVNKLISKLEAILNHADESYAASPRIINFSFIKQI